MSQLRPYSQTSSRRSHSKPGFQTKLKPRVSGLASYQDKLNASTDVNRNNYTQQFYTQRKNNIQQNNQCCKHEDNQFYKTASKLSTVNFQNHDPQLCVCSECSCGRHLCKFNNIKPDLTKNTIYKQDFNRKAVINPQIIKPQEYEKLNGPHLGMNSTHRQSFTKRQSDKIQRPKPEDLLKSSGPSFGLTSYRSGFPGFRGPNQYVKPTDNHIRDNFPFRSKSTYNHTYVNKDPKKDDYKYMNDMLKTGGNFYGKSTYGNFFENPNPEYHAKKVKLVQKKNQNPNFSKQYQTVYKNDFIPKGPTVCAAKIHLQTIARGKFSGSKSVFSQNADFKAMSPEYQAFSTSGFSFA